MYIAGKLFQSKFLWKEGFENVRSNVFAEMATFLTSSSTTIAKLFFFWGFPRLKKHVSNPVEKKVT